jgi:hypothetical protein
VLLAEFPEDELRSREGIAKQAVDRVAGAGHGVAAEAPAQDSEGKEELQADAPGDGAQPNSATVGGKEPCQQQHGEQAKDSSESRQFRLVLNG